MVEDYLCEIGNALCDMRLLVEGAVVLYETDASLLYAYAVRNEHAEAVDAFESIGAALYQLRTQIREQQKEHALRGAMLQRDTGV